MSRLRELRRQARAALALGWLNGVVAARRNPLWVLSYLAPPLSLLMMIKIFAVEEALNYALIGGLLMTAASNGLGIMGDAVFYKNTVKLQDMLVASPMRPLSYVAGLVLSSLLFAIPGFAIFGALMVSRELVGLESAPSVLFATLLATASLACLGFTLATFVREERFVWPLLGILTFTLTILPPVYYPIDRLPWALRLASLLVPTSNAAALIHVEVGLVRPEELPVGEAAAWLVALVEAALLAAAATYRSRWREA
ncbi:MAG: ABC transporter permease [Fervidicoccaceae archaeon]